MCIFFSAIVKRNGDVLWHWNADSHSDLVLHFKLRDNKMWLDHFAKIEFTPAVDSKGVPQFADVDKYTLRVDEVSRPAWFDEIENTVLKKCQSIIRGMIIKDDSVPLILDGCRILIGSASVRDCKGGRIVSMSDSSNVGYMSGSSKVGYMYDSSKVGSMSGSSNVGSMYDSSKVGSMSDSSNVGYMSGSSKVGSMYDSSNVGYMSGSSNVGSMYDSSKVGSMSDSSKVGSMSDSSNVGFDKRKKETTS